MSRTWGSTSTSTRACARRRSASYPKPVPTRHCPRSVSAFTRTGRPSTVAPAPRPAVQVRPSTTECTAPARTVHSSGSGGPTTAATDTAYDAIP